MRRIIIGVFLILLQNLCYAQSGKIDSTFAAIGVVHTDFFSANDQAQALAIQADGRIVVAGYATNHNQDFATARYKKNGTLDSTFGRFGKVVIPVDTQNDFASNVLLQTDGKILLTGYAQVGYGAEDFAVVRLKVDGALDNNFGLNGKVTTPIGTGLDVAWCSLLQPDGKIVLAGYVANGSGGDVGIVRYNNNGSLDYSFNGTGIVTTDFSGDYDIVRSVALQPDGKIVIAGSSTIGNKYVYLIARYNSNGKVDSSFGVHGCIKTAVGSTEDDVSTLMIQPDGKIVVGGASYRSNLLETDIVLIRYNANGTVDNSFGTSGRVIIAYRRGLNFIRSMALQPDGKIVLVGLTDSLIGTTELAMARLNTNGTPDTTFGIKGKVITSVYDGSIPSTLTGGTDIKLQTDAKILVSGFVLYPNGTDFALIRYINDFKLGIMDFTEGNKSLLFYPNPIQPKSCLEYTLDKTETISISITDLSGRIIASPVTNEVQSAGNHKQTIELPQDLPTGQYLLSIRSANGFVSVKIIK